jgi:hypothetical protein
LNSILQNALFLTRYVTCSGGSLMAPIAWTIGASLPTLGVGSSVRSHGQSVDHGLTKMGESLTKMGESLTVGLSVVGIGIALSGGMIGAAIIIKK